MDWAVYDIEESIHIRYDRLGPNPGLGYRCQKSLQEARFLDSGPHTGYKD
jgi:hypothetical protein